VWIQRVGGNSGDVTGGVEMGPICYEDRIDVCLAQQSPSGVCAILCKRLAGI
jgi:hypothetical protein